VGIVLVACSPATERRRSGAEVAAGAERERCPYADFSAFLAAFGESAAVQERFTRIPLRERHLVDDGPGEPRTVERLLSPADVRFPVFPSGAERAARRLSTVRIRDEGVARRAVVVSQPDTDYQLRFVFERDACWVLVAVEDWSL
jgi:hypothetical protein